MDVSEGHPEVLQDENAEWARGNAEASLKGCAPYILHPTPYTLHPDP